MSTRIVYNGDKDYSQVFQQALDKGGEIIIDKGFYRLSATLRIKSDTRIEAHRDAIMYTADNSKKCRNDFLLTNDDPLNGNVNISVYGGVWDGNCLNNKRGKLFGGGYTGTMFNFFNVKNLILENLVLKNPECYYVRLCRVKKFSISDILFDSEFIRPNQDGIHLAGFCYDGKISGLKGSPGSPNDDFVALNADDCLTRLQNLDVLCGEIKNISIEDLESPYCHSFVRLLSVNSAISNVKIRNLKGSCKAFVINADGARYCKKGTRLLSILDKRYFRGCGSIENVKVENVEVYSRKMQKALILIETDVNDFEVNDFRTSPEYNRTPALSVGFNAPSVIEAVSGEGTSQIKEKGYYKRVKLKPEYYKKITINKRTDDR